MVDRLEIPKKVKLEVYKRAGGPENVRCEKCGLPLRGKVMHYDHTKPEWLQSLPKSERIIVAEDVRLLGWDCCHKPKTAQEATERAHGNRIVEKAARAKQSRTPVCGGRAAGMDGTVIDLRTGRMLKRGHSWQRYARKIERKHGITINCSDGPA